MDNIQEAMFLLKQAVEDVDRLLAVPSAVPPVMSTPAVTPPALPHPPRLSFDDMVLWCKKQHVDFEKGLGKLPVGWKWGAASLNGLFCIFPDGWKYRDPACIKQSDVPPLVEGDTYIITPESPDLTRDQVLKWCVENQPSFSNIRPDVIPPQGWFWQRSEGGVDKYLISENRKDTVFEVDVMVYVDPVDIVDPIMSREQAIEWCIEQNVDFDKPMHHTNVPKGWQWTPGSAEADAHLWSDDLPPILKHSVENYIDKTIAADVGLNRAEMIQWCKDNDPDFKGYSRKLPEGWVWQNSGAGYYVIESTIHPSDVT